MSLSLYWARTQSSPDLGLLTRHRELEAEFSPEQQRHWNLDKFGTGRATASPAPSSPVEAGLTPLQWPQVCEHGITFPGQSKTDGWTENHKALQGVRIRTSILREGRRNTKKRSWSVWPLRKQQSALVWAASLLRQCGCGISSFRTGPEVYTQGSTPRDLRVVKSSWYTRCSRSHQTSL